MHSIRFLVLSDVERLLKNIDTSFTIRQLHSEYIPIKVVALYSENDVKAR